MGILKKIEAKQKIVKKQHAFLMNGRLIDEYREVKRVAKERGYKFDITQNVENSLRSSIAMAKKELGI